MKGKCYFTKQSDKVKEILNQIKNKYKYQECLCVYKNRSNIFTEEILNIEGINFVSFKNYGKETNDILKNNKGNILVVVGLSDMIRPSNRCDIRFEYMYNFSKYKYKFVIDEVPFKEEKWRIWYPYSVFNPDLIGYPHSYAIETDYQNYIDSKYREDENLEDPIPVDELISKTKNYTEIYYKKYFDFDLEFNIYQANMPERAEYERIKKELFEKEKTPHKIIKKLHEYAQSIYPSHNLIRRLKKIYKINSSLDNDTLFEKPKVTFNMTDLNVDKYLKSELERLVNETNQITEGLYE